MPVAAPSGLGAGSNDLTGIPADSPGKAGVRFAGRGTSGSRFARTDTDRVVATPSFQSRGARDAPGFPEGPGAKTARVEGQGTPRLRLGSLTAAVVLLVIGLFESSGVAAHLNDVPSPDGEWLVRTWEAEDGLPENSATAMVQTADRYLWFGTFNGLVRFDGVRFAVLTPSNTPQLPDSGIVNLHLGQNGRLWISTLNGLVWRDSVQWGRPSGAALSAAVPIRTFSERANGDLLLTTFNGRVYEFVGGILKELPPPPGQPKLGYHGGVDESGRWWVVQAGFVGLWNGTAWESKLPGHELPDATDRTACAQARDGGLWVLLDSELRKFSNGVEVSRRRLDADLRSIWSLNEDSRGNLWICSFAHGVHQVAPDGRVRLWSEAGGLSYSGTRFAFEDHERNVWIGTSGGGLTRLKERRFRSFGRESGLSSRVVKSVWPAPGDGVWIGTYGGGLFRLEGDTISSVTLPQHLVPGRYVQSVLADRKGRIWVGTFGHGLFVREAADWRSIPSDQTGGDNVIALFEDSSGRIWVSGGQTASVLDSDRFRSFGPEEGLPRPGVRCFGEDRAGNVWASNYRGVYRLENGRFTEVRASQGGPIEEIACLHADSDGTMWMGSLNNGLVRWRPGRTDRIKAPRGLPTAGVHEILEDGQGGFWMASNRGILRADRDHLNALAEGTSVQFAGQLFDQSDGLASPECPAGQQPIAAVDGRGRIWFATLRGVSMTDPGTLRINSAPPPVTIESISFQEESSEGETEESDESIRHRMDMPLPAVVRLPAGSRRIEIQYAAPSFVSPEKVRFQTRLWGVDTRWRNGDAHRMSLIENLEPGSYIFQVRAANHDGVWSAEAGLALEALPFFWETTWFRILGSVSLAAGIGTLLIRAKRRLDRKAAQQTAFARQLIIAQENERARLARELHDDITQRLARLAIDAGQLEHKANSQRERRALAEVREGLADLSQDVHGLSYRLHPSILEELGLIDALRAEADRFSQESSLPVVVDVSGVPASIPRDSALCLFRIAQAALRNILRHAQARHVSLILRGQNGGLELVVEDDGVGFRPASRDRDPSLGISSMHERANLMGGRLDIDSAPGEGTAVIVWLPLEPEPSPQ